MFGLATYGYKIMRVLGTKAAKLTNARGFCVELSTAIVVMVASYTGLPVSTTQTVTGAIIAMGCFDGLKGVNWYVVGKVSANSRTDSGCHQTNQTAAIGSSCQLPWMTADDMHVPVPHHHLPACISNKIAMDLCRLLRTAMKLAAPVPALSYTHNLLSKHHSGKLHACRRCRWRPAGCLTLGVTALFSAATVSLVLYAPSRPQSLDINYETQAFYNSTGAMIRQLNATNPCSGSKYRSCAHFNTYGEDDMQIHLRVAKRMFSYEGMGASNCQLCMQDCMQADAWMQLVLYSDQCISLIRYKPV